MSAPSSMCRAAPAVTAQQLWFTQEQQVAIREQVLPAPGAGEVLVRVCCSAISAGTELLVYRGQLPEGMSLDSNLASLQGGTGFPLQYGYACVGRVQQAGPDVDGSWMGRLVFAFQPHASHFVASAASLKPLPDDIEPEAGVFLPNMETAVNLVQDGSPGLGERVVVLGQGIVGLLLSSLLAQFPLQRLWALDGIAARRSRALQSGVHQVCDPGSATELAALTQQLSAGEGATGADLIYEVSGAPEALNLAVALSGYTSRIVIGSWYGIKTATIALGGEAHRNRLSISTSQVSTLAPQLRGRWDKVRRASQVWDLIRCLQPQQLITHRVPFNEAGALYKLLHQAPDDVLQALFVYPSGQD